MDENLNERILEKLLNLEDVADVSGNTLKSMQNTLEGMQSENRTAWNVQEDMYDLSEEIGATLESFFDPVNTISKVSQQILKKLEEGEENTDSSKSSNMSTLNPSAVGKDKADRSSVNHAQDSEQGGQVVAQIASLGTGIDENTDSLYWIQKTLDSTQWYDRANLSLQEDMFDLDKETSNFLESALATIRYLPDTAEKALGVLEFISLQISQIKPNNQSVDFGMNDSVDLDSLFEGIEDFDLLENAHLGPGSSPVTDYISSEMSGVTTSIFGLAKTAIAGGIAAGGGTAVAGTLAGSITALPVILAAGVAIATGAIIYSATEWAKATESFNKAIDEYVDTKKLEGTDRYLKNSARATEITTAVMNSGRFEKREDAYEFVLKSLARAENLAQKYGTDPDETADAMAEMLMNSDYKGISSSTYESAYDQAVKSANANIKNGGFIGEIEKGVHIFSGMLKNVRTSSDNQGMDELTRAIQASVNNGFAVVDSYNIIHNAVENPNKKSLEALGTLGHIVSPDYVYKEGDSILYDVPDKNNNSLADNVDVASDEFRWSAAGLTKRTNNLASKLGYFETAFKLNEQYDSFILHVANTSQLVDDAANSSNLEAFDNKGTLAEESIKHNIKDHSYLFGTENPSGVIEIDYEQLFTDDELKQLQAAAAEEAAKKMLEDEYKSDLWLPEVTSKILDRKALELLHKKSLEEMDKQSSISPSSGTSDVKHTDYTVLLNQVPTALSSAIAQLQPVKNEVAVTFQNLAGTINASDPLDVNLLLAKLEDSIVGIATNMPISINDKQVGV